MKASDDCRAKPGSRTEGSVGGVCPVLARRRLLAGASLLAAAGLSGCGTIKSVTGSVGSLASGLFSDKPIPPAWKSLVVTASQDANRNSPVALDLVFIKEAAISEALLASSASKWFATRADQKRSFPNAFTTLSLEVVPGQSLLFTPRHLEGHVGLTVLAFADYPGPGEHRERLSLKAEGYVIQLGARGFGAVEVGKR